MTTRIVLLVVPCLLLASCGPLIELEDENIALQTQVDSLQLALTECHAGTDLAHERLTVIERENLQLDDKNRQLQARLTEMQYASAPDALAQPSAPAQPAAPAQPVTPAQPVAPAQPAAPAHSGIARSTSPVSAPDYRAGMSADLAFLRGYQSALNAYNRGEFQRAANEFSAIMMTSRPNSMIDNCVYWLGQSKLKLGETAEALARFSTVISYQGSDKIPAALLSRGSLYMDGGQQDQARADFQRIVKEFPQSEQSGTAQQLLRKL